MFDPIIDVSGDVYSLDGKRIAIITGVNVPNGLSTKTVGVIDMNKLLGLCNCVQLMMIVEEWPRKNQKGGGSSTRVGYAVVDEPIVFKDRVTAEEALLEILEINSNVGMTI